MHARRLQAQCFQESYGEYYAIDGSMEQIENDKATKWDSSSRKLVSLHAADLWSLAGC